MKQKIKSLLLIMTFAATFVACKDDDDKKQPANYVFDGKTTEIKYAGYEDMTNDDGGGYRFSFYPSVIDENSEEWPLESIWIDIPKEMMGSKFELKAEQLYDWGWYIEYINDEKELEYEGFGAEGQMEDVKSGTMLATKKGTDTFLIEVDIVFNDGKTLKIRFDGKMINEGEEDEEPSRKPAKSNSPNN